MSIKVQSSAQSTAFVVRSPLGRRASTLHLPSRGIYSRTHTHQRFLVQKIWTHESDFVEFSILIILSRCCCRYRYPTGLLRGVNSFSIDRKLSRHAGRKIIFVCVRRLLISAARFHWQLMLRDYLFDQRCRAYLSIWIVCILIQIFSPFSPFSPLYHRQNSLFCLAWEQGGWPPFLATTRRRVRPLVYRPDLKA